MDLINLFCIFMNFSKRCRQVFVDFHRFIPLNMFPIYKSEVGNHYIRIFEFRIAVDQFCVLMKKILLVWCFIIELKKNPFTRSCFQRWMKINPIFLSIQNFQLVHLSISPPVFQQIAFTISCPLNFSDEHRMNVGRFFRISEDVDQSLDVKESMMKDGDDC